MVVRPRTFCVDDEIERREAASLLARALELPQASQDFFFDDNGLTGEANINRMAEPGITIGCGQLRFCPFRWLTREEVAGLLFRALS